MVPFWRGNFIVPIVCPNSGTPHYTQKEAIAKTILYMIIWRPPITCYPDRIPRQGASRPLDLRSFQPLFNRICSQEKRSKSSLPKQSCFWHSTPIQKEQSRGSSGSLSLTAEVWPKDGEHDHHCGPDHSRKEHVHLDQTTIIEEYHPCSVYRSMKENTDENTALRVKVDPGDEDAETGSLCYQQQEVNKT